MERKKKKGEKVENIIKEKERKVKRGENNKREGKEGEKREKITEEKEGKEVIREVKEVDAWGTRPTAQYQILATATVVKPSV